MNRLLYTESTTDDIDTCIHLMPVSESYDIDLTKTTNSILVYRNQSQLTTFIVNGDGNDVSFGLNKLQDCGTGDLQLKLLVQTSEQKIYYPSGNAWVNLSISVDNTGKVSLVSLDDSVANAVYQINQGNNISDDSGQSTNQKSDLPTIDILNPQVTVGKVESLPYDSQPTVQVVKNGDYEIEFNFDIPKGDKGDIGATGPAGPQGVKGDPGDRGPQGPQGPKGNPGKPFSIAKVFPSKDAMTGDGLSEGDFVMIASNVDDPNNGTLFTWDGTSFKEIADLPGAQGIQGPQGPQGPKGDTGRSAYQAWLDAGNIGTEAQFLASLKGPQGAKGDTGDRGPQGPQGPKGDTGATGPQGAKGDTGATGPAGKTPVRGTDYWTTDDQDTIKQWVKDQLMQEAF